MKIGTTNAAERRSWYDCNAATITYHTTRNFAEDRGEPIRHRDARRGVQNRTSGRTSRGKIYARAFWGAPSRCRFHEDARARRARHLYAHRSERVESPTAVTRRPSARPTALSRASYDLGTLLDDVNHCQALTDTNFLVINGRASNCFTK